jgi:CRP-like cAMP-binding protein
MSLASCCICHREPSSHPLAYHVFLSAQSMKLAEAMKPCKFSNNDLVVREGERADSLFLVTDGEVSGMP